MLVMKIAKHREKLFDQCIVEMGRRVGLDWKTFDDVLKYQKENGVTWYTTQTWSKQEQDDFSEWMKDLLKKEKFTEKIILNEVGWFLLSYGWKVNYEAV